jgi:hypothetical protein
MVIGIAVREVQARDCHAGLDHPYKRLRIVGCRTECRYYLCSSLHGQRLLHSSVSSAALNESGCNKSFI